VSAIGGVVVDSTALLAFVSGRPYASAMVWHAVDQSVVLVVPAASLADAQARLAPADLEVIETLVDLPVSDPALLRALAADIEIDELP